MQSLKYLSEWLAENTNEQHYLFSFNDLRAIFNTHAENAFKTLLSRAVKGGLLMRPCRGIYCYPKARPSDGLLLFHVAALLRANHFNYISLETALSDAGVISQIPFNWIHILSSGRSNKINCSDAGTIEFIHTAKTPAQLEKHLNYDHRCGLWRADVALAIRDMKTTNRSTDLIDWSTADAIIRSTGQ